MEDIHEIKPLMSLDFPWLAFLATAGIILGLCLLLGWFVWRLLKRKPPAEPEEPPPLKVDPQTLREEALAALDRLAQSQAMKQERGQDVYLELEAIFKRFLEGMHHKPVTGFTDQELEDFLKAQPQVHWQDSGLEPLLQRSLYARFAKGSPSQTQMQEDLRLLKQFVQKHTAD
ncbi:MAG: DUF4381 family protein [Candidatus Sericytochromatia bacterium]|nr:DUF4381 family protein [Candidatus Sericytochromatia bacterium]